MVVNTTEPAAIRIERARRLSAPDRVVDTQERPPQIQGPLRRDDHVIDGKPGPPGATSVGLTIGIGGSLSAA
jgi:hypothetical protein